MTQESSSSRVEPSVAAGGETQPLERGPAEDVTTLSPRRWRQLLLATVFGAMVFAALSLYGDITALGANLAAYRWWTFAVAVLLATGNYGLRFLRWQLYLERLGIRVDLTPSALIFLAGFAMSVTPGKVGELMKSALLLEHHGAPLSRTAPIVVAERVTDLVALVLLTALGSLAFEAGVPVAVGGAVLAGALLAVCVIRPLGELFIATIARLPVVWRLTPKLREAYDALYDLTRPKPLAWGTALGTAAWFLEVLSLHVILWGLGVDLEWLASTFAYSASTIAGAVAMMPGGLGVTEAGMTGLLLALSDELSPAAATGATILTRLATLWWAVVVGFVALGVYRRLPSKGAH